MAITAAVVAVASVATTVGSTVYANKQQKKADKLGAQRAAEQQRIAERQQAALDKSQREQNRLFEEQNRLQELSIKQQREAIKQDKLALAEQRNRDAQIERRQRRQEIRAERAQRAELENAAAQTGTGTSSGPIGGATALRAQLNSSLGFGNRISSANDRISGFLQGGANARGSAQILAGQASNFGGKAQQEGVRGAAEAQRLGVIGQRGLHSFTAGIAKANRGIQLARSIGNFGQQGFSTAFPYAIG